MDRFLIPGAIVLAALIIAATFRYDVQTMGERNHIVLVQDRWTGSAKYCGGQAGSTACFEFLATGYAPIEKASR